MKPQIGQTYKSYRREIVDAKEKYHLYLADDIVFLINSKANYFDFGITLNKNDSAIFTKDCFLQLNKIYSFDKSYNVIAVSDMSPSVLSKMRLFLNDNNISKSIPKIYIKRAIAIIEDVLENKTFT